MKNQEMSKEAQLDAEKLVQDTKEEFRKSFKKSIEEEAKGSILDIFVEKMKEKEEYVKEELKKKKEVVKQLTREQLPRPRGRDFDFWKEEDNYPTKDFAMYQEKTIKKPEITEVFGVKQKDNIVVFSDGTEFDIEKGFTMEELHLILGSVWCMDFETLQKLKSKLGFLYQMKRFPK